MMSSLIRAVKAKCLTGVERFHNQRRLKRVPAQLAQDLEIMAGALRSGCSLAQALQVTAQEGHPPLAGEWKMILHEIRLGATWENALSALQQRVPLRSVSAFGTAVQVTQETGGNLAGVLTTLAGTIRDEITFQGKLAAMTAQGKASGYVVGVIPFLLVGVLQFIAPDLMNPLFTTGLGRMLLAVAAMFVVIGVMVIRKITTIEV